MPNENSKVEFIRSASDLRDEQLKERNLELENTNKLLTEKIAEMVDIQIRLQERLRS